MGQGCSDFEELVLLGLVSVVVICLWMLDVNMDVYFAMVYNLYSCEVCDRVLLLAKRTCVFFEKYILFKVCLE